MLVSSNDEDVKYCRCTYGICFQSSLNGVAISSKDPCLLTPMHCMFSLLSKSIPRYIKRKNQDKG